MPLIEHLKKWFGSRQQVPVPPTARLGAAIADYVARRDEASLEARKLVDLVLQEAVRVGASDIHFDPAEAHVLVRFRIDGILYDVATLPGAVRSLLANRLKVMADLKIHERRVPQDGKARMDPELGGFEMRVSVSPMVHGEKISIRLFRPGEQRFELSALGFDAEISAGLRRLIEQPAGLLLLAGPVGSGKTTTLYAALSHLARTRGERLNITTVEDPVECSLPRVNQASVNQAQGFTYPVALRSILRHDPQVIMIGEIRDEETASIAIRASLSGHLVLSTVHSATAAGAFARLINLKVDPPLLASATLGVLNLRLVRLNCPACSEPYEPEPALMERLRGRDLSEAFFRQGAGCPACGFTRFRGRAPVAELLTMNPVLEKVVREGGAGGELDRLAVGQGMRPLREDALRRVFAGETTLAEVADCLG